MGAEGRAGVEALCRPGGPDQRQSDVWRRDHDPLFRPHGAATDRADQAGPAGGQGGGPVLGLSQPLGRPDPDPGRNRPPRPPVRRAVPFGRPRDGRSLYGEVRRRRLSRCVRPRRARPPMTDERSKVSLTLDRDFMRGVFVALAAGLVLAFTGAFGMGHTPFWFRVAYWEPIMLMGALWGHLCSMMIGRYIDADRRPWTAALVMTAVISGPLAVMVWTATTLWFDDDRSLRLDRLVDFLAPVTVVTGVLCVLTVFLDRTPPQTHAAPAGSAPVRFLERLPPRLRGATLRAVQAEDHYLRLHTDRGSDL